MKTTQEEAERFFSRVFGGKHHIPGKILPYGEGWAVNSVLSLATFDTSVLTWLVFRAHEECFRVEIMPASPVSLKIAIWKRKKEGRFYERHPTLDEAVNEYRRKPVKVWPKE